MSVETVTQATCDQVRVTGRMCRSTVRLFTTQPHGEARAAGWGVVHTDDDEILTFCPIHRAPKKKS